MPSRSTDGAPSPEQILRLALDLEGRVARLARDMDGRRGEATPAVAEALAGRRAVALARVQAARALARLIRGEAA